MEAKLVDESTDVVIVGGGIVGLSASLLLLQYQVPFVLVEKHSSTCIHPRARAVNTRTREIYRELKVEEKLQALEADRAKEGGIMGAKTLKEGLDGFQGHMVMASHIEKYRACSPSGGSLLKVTQDLLEPVLLDTAKEKGGDVRFDTVMTSFSQTTDFVQCSLLNKSSNKTTTLTAKYMIAADGANSFVRKQIGASVSGKGTLGRLVNILFKADLSEQVKGREFTVCRIDNGDVSGIFTAINMKDKWAFHVLDRSPQDFQHYSQRKTKEHYTAEECIRVIRIGLGMPEVGSIEVLGIMPWTSAMNVTDQFVHDRIFFAGDAAHQMPPWGGQGANSGVCDVHNLAWKLAYVLKGIASPGLLRSYHTERHPVTFGAALASANNADSSGLIDVSVYEQKQFGDPTPSYLLRLGRFLGIEFSYMNLEKEGETEQEPSKIAGIDGRPGTRVPHMWATVSRTNELVSTVDLCGRSRFVILAGSKGFHWRQAVEELHVEYLACFVVGASGDLIPKDEQNAKDQIAGDKWEDLAGIESTGAVLVRPDGVVGWRWKGEGGKEGELMSYTDNLRTAVKSLLGHAVL